MEDDAFLIDRILEDAFERDLEDTELGNYDERNWKLRNSKSEENIGKQVSGFSKNNETEEKNKQENGEKKGRSAGVII